MINPHRLTYDQAADGVVELGNKLVDEDDSVDTWDVASGMLAGAIEYWLFARQPCTSADCEVCSNVANAEQRLRTLLAEVQQLAEDADDYDSATDARMVTAQ